MLNIDINNSWDKFFEEERQKDYFKKLNNKVTEAYSNNICYPLKENIFNAFKYCELDDIKVVIIGQDPYHEPNQAHGLAFSVLNKVLPPSLKNIFKEIEQEYGEVKCNDGNLSNWANQGVLLLNRTLTVTEHLANSHKSYGWNNFTNNVISYINKHKSNVVYLLWGSDAISLSKFIDLEHNLVLTSPHPSPLSCYRGFLGNNHFKLANEYLKKNNIGEIEW